MLSTDHRKLLKRKDDRVIIHFDYDCFYAAVVENEQPALKSLPLAIQQKQIIVTCNYEARRRGLYKLQLITEAKRLCPDVVIVLGEDLTRFRDASKALYSFLRSFSWSDRVERLGFDEVWMDVTDIIDSNIDSLNQNDLSHSFFQLSRSDPTFGFDFDASVVAGHTYPAKHQLGDPTDPLTQRLILGSHLARYVRHQLEEQKGYTCTVGISTSKLLSKLVGNVNKPVAQTTLMPPYEADEDSKSNVITFIDGHDIGKIPWVGCKLSQKLREYVLGRPAEFETGLVYGGTKENVTVKDVRKYPNLSSDMLEKMLHGPGSHHGIGAKIFRLIHGVDNSDVEAARDVPRQISIEDSYIRLDSMQELRAELIQLSKKLIERMRLDLTELEHDSTGMSEPSNDFEAIKTTHERKWIGFPATIRLSTRPRLSLNPDGSRTRTFTRISRSAPVPSFMLTLIDDAEVLAKKLVVEVLIPLFRKLHPEDRGWNLSLVNVAVADMVDTSNSGRHAAGRDLRKMFKHQDDVLAQWTADDEVHQAGTTFAPLLGRPRLPSDISGADFPSVPGLAANHDNEWDTSSDEEMPNIGYYCSLCKNTLPEFAKPAHERFHSFEE